MKRILHILMILLALDAFMAAGLWWGYTVIQSKKDEGSELRKELLLQDQKGRNLIALKRTLATVEKDHEEMLKFLYDPSDESQIDFVSRMEQLGSSTTGARIETVSLDLSTDAQPSLRGSFSMSGTWGQMYHFLRLLEEFPSHLTISRFEVKGSGAGGVWSGTAAIVLDSLKSVQ
ncbi:MAG: hypothetical protein A2845_05795 [Candidatus Lloydbacteria bacterium RIFCSPHIGHO2_01_FULL_49_22]|uniref:Type 4 fimbrial biogenesis protein PilO n=1 Tax=Candidatus Lloydbacteria bacterium RIFCSPHIGHO2_01_FULL_49_22 TaxID=1798658 RepID=A0A1G2CVV8_9BACT|nr:MAG: hypothetical protein A2845_05795 [Candidatus Lloydbacteria bacterium RIFCSPHIGHO2_01_FULL_49_22]OGZ09804.1 MAG: hypothetical protein A3C14_00220 [Candidatus Lloydbacteria bacterium RIFCSPHIGHO2_02_FULL_50_18]